MPLQTVIIPAEDFFSPIIEQWSLDYRTMEEWPEKLDVNRYLVKNFWYLPDWPLEFVKIEGKYVYKTNREKRIPVRVANGVTIVSLDNAVFKQPWISDHTPTWTPEYTPTWMFSSEKKPQTGEKNA